MLCFVNLPARFTEQDSLKIIGSYEKEISKAAETLTTKRKLRFEQGQKGTDFSHSRFLGEGVFQGRPVKNDTALRTRQALADIAR